MATQPRVARGPFTGSGSSNFDIDQLNNLDIASWYDGTYSRVDSVLDQVNNLLADQDSRLTAALASMTSAVSALGSFDPSVMKAGVLAPQSPDIAFEPGTFDVPDAVAPDSLDYSQPSRADRPDLDAVPDIYTPSTLEFTPSTEIRPIPEPPVPGAFEEPRKPRLDDVDIPAAPTLNTPALPDLEAISIPTFTPLNLPTFDATAPEFVGDDVRAVLQWDEPAYATEILDDVVLKLRELWAGGNGIPAAVENALWERAANREDLDTSRQIDAAYTEFANRGFTMPPGMLASRVDALRDEALVRKQGANREVAIRMAELHVENVRFACEQGIAAENVYVNIWDNMARRQFEAARIQLESQLNYYNAQVALFNAEQQAYSIAAQVFRSELEAELALLQEFRARVDAEVAKGQLNESRARVYGEQVRALQVRADLYRAQVQGAEAQASVNQSVIEGYRTEVQAFAEQLRADKVRFDAYEAQVRASVGTAQLYDAEARAYATRITAENVRVEADARRADSVIQQNRLKLEEYRGRLEEVRQEVEAKLATNQNRVAAYTAYTQRVVANSSQAEAEYRSRLAEKEVQIRSDLNAHELALREYAVKLEDLQREADAQLEALKFAAQTAATVIAGVSAGRSASLSMSASAGMSDTNATSASRSVQHSKSTQQSRSDSYTEAAQLE